MKVSAPLFEDFSRFGSAGNSRGLTEPTEQQNWEAGSESIIAEVMLVDTTPPSISALIKLLKSRYRVSTVGKRGSTSIKMPRENPS